MYAILFLIFSVFPGIYLHSSIRELVSKCHTQEDYEKIEWKIKLYEYSTNIIAAIDITLITVLSIAFFFVIPFTFLFILEETLPYKTENDRERTVSERDEVNDSEENNLNRSSGMMLGALMKLMNV
ncbi:hypothetical protein ABK040_006297 [Willaertia magna]